MQENNILFIIPPYLPLNEYVPSKVGQKLPLLTPPYGILSIISYINQDKKYNIEILDLNYEIITKKIIDKKEIEILIKQKIETLKPFFIGISALFNTSFPHLKYICLLIKQTDDHNIIMVGGGLATNLYIDLFNEISDIDVCCYGEGEVPLKKLLNELTNFDTVTIIDELYKLSPALITHESIRLNLKPEYDFIYNLDEIPIIDFSYIDLKKYNGRSYINKDSNNIEISIHTSRGCPYNCIYCSNYIVHGKKIRTMSNDMFLNTIRYYIDNYNIHTLMIEDDHFLSNKKRAIFLLNELSKLNINVEFPNGIAVFKIDEDIAKALNDAKVKILPLAIESGSDYVLHDIINKPLTKKQIYKAVGCLQKYDIRLHAFIVIGFPYEYQEHRQETLNLLLEIGIDWAHIFIVVPIAGSRLYKQCLDNNYLLTTDYNKYTISNCNIKAPGIEPEQIEEYAQYMNLVINFLENANFINMKYDICLQYFNNVVNHYPDHAIAHYMLYKVYIEIEEEEKAEYHFLKFTYLRNTNEFYRKMINKFKDEGYIFGRL